MRREIDLKEISDGRLYTENDLVKAGCGDCQGCSACCRGMGTSIVLDPLDIFRLTTQLEMTFEQLLQKYAELNVVDGVILPNLKMTGAEEACAFLNAEGDVPFIRIVRAFVVCSRLEDIMRTIVFSIFCKYTNVRRNQRRK